MLTVLCTVTLVKIWSGQLHKQISHTKNTVIHKQQHTATPTAQPYTYNIAVK